MFVTRASSTAGVLLLLFATAAPAQNALQDYPHWRGQSGDGSASAFSPPSAWPETLTRKWKVDVGDGYATPIIVGNAVYTFTRRDDREVLTALDAATGARRWQTSYPAPYMVSTAAAAHGAGPKATPAFHEGKVFTLGISGIVAAFDAASGSLLWRTDPPAEHPYFSAASSPLGDTGVVLAHPGNYGPLTAFDATSGKIRWTAGDGGFFASPLVTTLAGARQAITVTQSSVIGVSIADGAVLWRYPWPGGMGGTMPVIYGGTVIVSAPNAGVAAYKPGRRDGQWITETVWETKEVWMYLCNPVVIGDALFGLSARNGGQFFALDAKTGHVLWLGQPRQATNTAVVKAGDLLLLLDDDGELIVARGSRAGFEPLKRYIVADSATWAQPAISGNRVFVKDVTSLTLWTLP
jgi:outer membrane protein assembly factor BamB